MTARAGAGTGGGRFELPTLLKLLERAASGAGVSPILITERAKLDAVADWVAQGNTLQLCDPRWRQELIAWIRFNEREARQSLDGLWSRPSGNPEMPRVLSRLLLPLVLTPRSQNRKDVPWITGSAGVLVFVSDVDDLRRPVGEVLATASQKK